MEHEYNSFLNKNVNYSYQIIKKYIEDVIRFILSIIQKHIENIKISNIFIQNITNKLYTLNKNNIELFITDLKSKFYPYMRNCWDSIPKTINNDRGVYRIKSLKKYILDKCNINPIKYLDIGCYDGEITKQIGLYYKTDTHGIDVKKYKEYDFTFKTYDSLIPYKDNTFDLITCFMVLHHVDDEKLNTLIKEIYRVSNNNCIIIIREHNVQKNINKLCLDIMHDIYDNVYNDSHSIWKTNYKNHKDWENLFNNNNMKNHINPVLNNNAMMAYYASYKSIKRINHTLYRTLPDFLPKKKYIVNEDVSLSIDPTKVITDNVLKNVSDNFCHSVNYNNIFMEIEFIIISLSDNPTKVITDNFLKMGSNYFCQSVNYIVVSSNDTSILKKLFPDILFVNINDYNPDDNKSDDKHVLLIALFSPFDYHTYDDIYNKIKPKRALINFTEKYSGDIYLHVNKGALIHHFNKTQSIESYQRNQISYFDNYCRNYQFDNNTYEKASCIHILKKFLIYKNIECITDIIDQLYYDLNNLTDSNFSYLSNKCL